jgi:hypothetical protein
VDLAEFDARAGVITGHQHRAANHRGPWKRRSPSPHIHAARAMSRN